MLNNILRKWFWVIFPATVLYAILVFYLSVTSNIGNLKHLIGITFGKATVHILTASHLSFVLDFLVDSLHFVERQSLDPGHLGVYFGFGVLLYFFFSSIRNHNLEKYAAIFTIFIGTAYGILNEIFQMYLPYRTPSVEDAISNLLGLALAQICVIIFILMIKSVQNLKTRKEGSLD